MVWARATLAAALGMGLMTPAASAQLRANNANMQGPAQPATGSYLGVWVWQVDAARAKDLHLPEVAGVVVTLVSPGSPAEAAGLRTGDVVVEFDQKKITGIEQFTQLVHDTSAGRTVRMRIVRNGASQTLTAKIGAIADSDRPGPIEGTLIVPQRGDAPSTNRQDVPQSLMTWRSPLLGIEAESLLGQLAQYFGVKEGVLVRSVTAGLPAQKAGVKAGDVILRVGKNPVSTPNDVAAQVWQTGSSVVKLAIMRDRHEITVVVPIE